MKPYEVAHISELETRTVPDSPRWAPVRSTFEITAFGINAWTADKAGQKVIGEHDEQRSGHEEIYFVASGHALFTIEGEEVDAPAGTFVFVPPVAKRKATAKEPETTVVAAGGTPGQAFEPQHWERSTHALAHWETQNWDAAVAELSELHEQHPDDAGILYNLACAESMGDRQEPALDHLGASIALDRSFAELAEKDSDFDPIREDPRFASAVARQPDTGSAGT